jgi:hypothetical protein
LCAEPGIVVKPGDGFAFPDKMCCGEIAVKLGRMTHLPSQLDCVSQCKHQHGDPAECSN